MLVCVGVYCVGVYCIFLDPVPNHSTNSPLLHYFSFTTIRAVDPAVNRTVLVNNKRKEKLLEHVLSELHIHFCKIRITAGSRGGGEGSRV